MFSWICPQCGRDVPPSKNDCPYCAERAQEAAAAQPGQQPQAPAPPIAPAAAWQTPVQYPPPPPAYAPQAYPPQQPYAQQPPAAWPPPAQRSSPPTWLMSVAFALAFIGIAAAVYFGMQRPSSVVAEKGGLENPANASKQKVSNPLQKYVEVVGLRLLQEDKKPIAKFLVVNHSSAEITDLSANVTLWASTSRSEEDSIGSFSFSISGLGPNGSKELTQPLKTKLKMYELPDWQNATAEIQITSPK